MVRTYAEAGVDIDAKGAQVRALVEQLRFRRRGLGAPWGPKGHFAGFVDMGRTALGVCTDSVGTKVLVANEMRRWDTVGVDCVAANVKTSICLTKRGICSFQKYVSSRSRVQQRPKACRPPQMMKPQSAGNGNDLPLHSSRIFRMTMEANSVANITGITYGKAHVWPGKVG